MYVQYMHYALIMCSHIYMQHLLSQLQQKDALLKDKDAELKRQHTMLLRKDAQLKQKDAELRHKDEESGREDAALLQVQLHRERHQLQRESSRLLSAKPVSCSYLFVSFSSIKAYITTHYPFPSLNGLSYIVPPILPQSL